jgi:hypothetical protein
MKGRGDRGILPVNPSGSSSSLVALKVRETNQKLFQKGPVAELQLASAIEGLALASTEAFFFLNLWSP